MAIRRCGKVRPPADGLIRQAVTLPDQYFGEGMPSLISGLVQLTWKENRRLCSMT